MKDIKLSDLNPSEKERVVREVDGDNAGCGVIHSGTYHLLAYRPVEKGKNSKKCIGVELFIRKADGTSKEWTPEVKVLYKQSLFAVRVPFKDRLASAIKEQTALTISLDKKIDDAIAKETKEKADRERAIQDHIEHVKSCKLKIDSTIKTLAPNARSVIEINSERLLMEKSKQEHERIESKRVSERIAEEADEDFKRATSAFLCGEYESEYEKNIAANNAILFREVEQPRSDRMESIQVEVMTPDNPKYLTDLEKSNASNAKGGV